MKIQEKSGHKGRLFVLGISQEVAKLIAHVSRFYSIFKMKGGGFGIETSAPREEVEGLLSCSR